MQYVSKQLQSRSGSGHFATLAQKKKKKKKKGTCFVYVHYTRDSCSTGTVHVLYMHTMQLDGTSSVLYLASTNQKKKANYLVIGLGQIHPLFFGSSLVTLASHNR